ncbi:MAG: dihydropteroate synthase [Kocuria sp.]|nr:dihydropteroate synthase [Kocuria sp.]MDO5619572.1 dihydropteroate synthase [Kocuria sp.]
MFQPDFLHPVRTMGRRTVDFRTDLLVMAVVNRTPDSFFDQGRTFALDRAVEAGSQAVREGADWVDIGGVPFSPGNPLPAREEQDRVLPVVEALHETHPETIISVDTFHASVADSCLAAGATVVNDTTGLSDPEMLSVVRERNAHLVITHSLTTSTATTRTVVPRPQYHDVVTQVIEFLRARVEYAVDAGVPPQHLLLDPGHDLNKNTVHSLELTRRLSELTALGHPTLAAVSNKDFVGESLGLGRDQRGEGSLAAAVVCALAGARVFRMHDAAASRRALDMTATIMGLRAPVELRHNMAERND